MVLTGAGGTATVSLNFFLTTVGAFCLIIGYLANWVSPFARRHRNRVSRLDNMLDDWVGKPARPGFPEIPSVPKRIETVEGLLDGHGSSVAVLEENIAHLNQKLKRTIDEQLNPLVATVEHIRAQVVTLQEILGDRIEFTAATPKQTAGSSNG